jgi:hypothetical protein
MKLVVVASVAACLLLASGAYAGPYVIQGPFGGAPGPGVPTPDHVSGKEYSDNPDKNVVPAIDPNQVIAWDGHPTIGGVADTFDYSGSGVTDGVDVDALANCADFLFHSVIANDAALLFSVTGPGIGGEDIDYETTGGAIGNWADPAPITGGGLYPIDQHGVTDLDGLEVWGGELVDDANRFSQYLDVGGVAVHAYSPGPHVSTPYITTVMLEGALGLPAGSGVDLDALMNWDMLCDDIFSTGDSILFSVAPLPGFFTGGEVWVWTFGSPAVFLSHG